MTPSKPTSGPRVWYRHDDPSDTRMAYRVRNGFTGEGGYFVAALPSEEEARFLTFAPELLAALESLMTDGKEHTFCFSEDCGRCQECAARAAIKKARGET